MAQKAVEVPEEEQRDRHAEEEEEARRHEEEARLEEERRQAEEAEAERRGQEEERLRREEEAERRRREEASRLEKASRKEPECAAELERVKAEQERAAAAKEAAAAQQVVNDFLKAKGFKNIAAPRKLFCGCGGAIHPLHLAVQENNLEAVKALLRCGADKELQNSRKKTPLEIAERCNKSGSHEMVLAALRERE